MNTLIVDKNNNCEGCRHCLHAGIRWPASPDGFNDLSYVEGCDYCMRYPDDEAAVIALAGHLGVRWGYAEREAEPKTAEHIRWEPTKDDGRDYTGWSAIVDHAARDDEGDEPSDDQIYNRPGMEGGIPYSPEPREG